MIWLLLLFVRCGNTAPLRLASDELLVLLTSNCKKVKVFEEMEELQNKHSEEKNDVPKWSEPDKKLSECKRLSHLVCEFDLAKLTHRCQLIANMAGDESD
jgi:hypothetical protein